MPRISTHNGRGYNGKRFNPNHNDRTSKRANENDEHIKDNLSYLNKYYNYYHDNNLSFNECEEQLYNELFEDYVNARNKRYKEHGQQNHCKGVKDLLNGLKTCPIETIFQLGDVDTFESVCEILGSDLKSRKLFRKVLMNAIKRLLVEIEPYTDNYIVSSIACHCEESSVHIHYRAVFFAKNEHGENMPNMNKALEQMGFDLPDPLKKSSRFNNRKITFDKWVRETWIKSLYKAIEEIEQKQPQFAKALELLKTFDLEPTHTQEHLQKMDYVIKKQQEEMEQYKRFTEYKDEFEQYIAECEDEIEKERSLVRIR